MRVGSVHCWLSVWAEEEPSSERLPLRIDSTHPPVTKRQQSGEIG